jgi:hypothetical protein
MRDMYLRVSTRKIYFPWYLPPHFYEISQLKNSNQYCRKMRENFHDFDIWGLGATVLRIMFGPKSLCEEKDIEDIGNKYKELNQ